MAEGGLRLGPNTGFEIVAYAVSAFVIVLALLRPAPEAPGRLYGGATLLFLVALLVWTGASIGWSLVPSESWLEYNRTAAYVGVFALGVAGLRLAPRRWIVPLAAILIATAVASAFALATKVAPGWLDPSVYYGRLREPYGYWNAVGVTAAMGIPPALWLGTRGAGRPELRAVAYPVLGILLCAMLFAFSRGSLAAAVLALGLWFIFVPLRLRSLMVLLVAVAAAGLVTAYGFSQSALVNDAVDLTDRESAGIKLGVALALMLALLAVAGVLLERQAEHRRLAPALRRRLGIAAICAVALLPLIGLGVLAASPGGIGHQVSKGWNQVTNEKVAPSNDPGRLVATSSARARYWREALRIFDAHRLAGAGAGSYPVVRLRYRHNDVTVRHAHGYVVQTLADLGLVGLLLSLLAAGAWLVAGARTLGLWRGALDSPWTPERYGLAALGLVALTFGIHSAIDWTWFVPGVALIGLVAAGWVAARGPLRASAEAPQAKRKDGAEQAPPADSDGTDAGPGEPEQPLIAGGAEAPTADLAVVGDGWRARLRSLFGVAAALVVALALALCWSAYRPWRADHQATDALELSAARHSAEARSAADRAVDLNPLSIDPLFDLAAVEEAANRLPAAQSALSRAVKVQPANPETWKRLGEFELLVQHRPAAAKKLLGAALFLDPRSADTQALILQADRLQVRQADRLRAARERRRAERLKKQRKERKRRQAARSS